MLCLQLQITLSLQYYLEVITVNIRSKALLLRAGLGGGGVGGGTDQTHLCPKPGFACLYAKLLWRRQWQATPVLLPRKSHGWRSLVGCSPWGH